MMAVKKRIELKLSPRISRWISLHMVSTSQEKLMEKIVLGGQG